MKKTTWKYIAGFLDADGSITFHKKGSKNKIYPQIVIGNTNKKVLTSIKNSTGLGYIIKTNQHKRKGFGIKSKKIMWFYMITRQDDIKEFLEKIIPFLIIKKEKAKKTISMITPYKSYKSKHSRKFK